MEMAGVPTRLVKRQVVEKQGIIKAIRRAFWGCIISVR
jgi:hypothetical protein